MEKHFCDNCGIMKVKNTSEYVPPFTWFTIIVEDYSRRNTTIKTIEREFCSVECSVKYLEELNQNDDSIKSTRNYYTEKGKKCLPPEDLQC